MKATLLVKQNKPLSIDEIKISRLKKTGYIELI